MALYPQTVYDYLVLALFGTYFVLSVIGQFEIKLNYYIRGFDPFALLPIWTFFAPNPGQTDYHLLYRDKLSDGTVTELREIEVTETRRWISFLWNPEKHSKKVLSDVVAMAVDSLPSDRPVGRELMLTLPYLLLLNVVCHQGGDGGARAGARRQFLVVETFGIDRIAPLRVLIQSEFHPLAAAYREEDTCQTPLPSPSKPPSPSVPSAC